MIILFAIVTITCLLLIEVLNKYGQKKSKVMLRMAKEVLKEGGHITLYEDARWINLHYGDYCYKIRRNFKNGKYKAICTPRNKNDNYGIRFIESYCEFDTKEEAQKHITREVENSILKYYV